MEKEYNFKRIIGSALIGFVCGYLLGWIGFILAIGFVIYFSDI